MVVEGSHKSLLFEILGDSTFKKSSHPQTSRTERNNLTYLPKTEQYHPLFEERAPNQSHDIQEKLAFSTFSQGNLEQGVWKSDKMSDSEKIPVALENFCKHLWVFLSSYRSTFLPTKSCSGFDCAALEVHNVHWVCLVSVWKIFQFVPENEETAPLTNHTTGRRINPSSKVLCKPVSLCW